MCHPGDPCGFAPMPCPAVTTSARVLLCLENTSACSMKSLLNEKLAQLQTYLFSNTIQRTRGVTPHDSVNKQHAIAYLWTKISFITAMFQHLGALLACCLGSGRTYIRSGAVFRSEGSPSNPKDLCHFLLEVKDVCRKHRRSFGFKGQPHKSFRSKGLAIVPSMKSI